MEKASQKKSILKNFVKLENFQSPTKSSFNFFNEDEDKKNEQENQNIFDDEYETIYGIENEFQKSFKEKI